MTPNQIERKADLRDRTNYNVQVNNHELAELRRDQDRYRKLLAVVLELEKVIGCKVEQLIREHGLRALLPEEQEPMGDYVDNAGEPRNMTPIGPPKCERCDKLLAALRQLVEPSRTIEEDVADDTAKGIKRPSNYY